MSDLINQIGYLFYPLSGLSVIAVTLIFERLIFFMRLPKLQNARSFQMLEKELDDNANMSKQIRDDLMSYRLADLQAKLTQGVHFLRLIAVLSPMLGLLGTVLGMIEAFRDIAKQTGPVIPSMIADGLWSAMLTTAYGLSIALPCLFAAFIFARLAEKRLVHYQKYLNAQSLKHEGAQLHD